MTVAAIFDLDRTLIAGSSAPVFQKHLANAGLGGHSVPLMDTYYKIYKRIGENPAIMQLARLGVRTAKGWPIDTVEHAVTAAAAELEDQVLPFAKQLIAEHQEAGVVVAIATTSPAPWVTPLAHRLGIQHVIASEWRHDGEVYTGEAEGPFLWGTAKRAGVAAWANSLGIDLDNSFAYSDSVYDVPLLGLVGNPVAVNPDPQLAVVAGLRRWPIRNFDVPPGVLKIAGREIQDWLRPINRPELIRNAQFSIDGVDNIPTDGPAIVVFNHRSYFDSTVVNLTLAKAGRPARFLGKKEVFDAPVVGDIARMVGGIRVDRGTGSDEPLKRAIAALNAGELVTMAPQGTIPRGPAFFEPKLQGRWGAARLAQATGAPVIPMGLWGTERVWPRSARFPSMDLTDPPMITVRLGEPVKLKYRSLDADTKRIMKAISKQLPAEANEPHTPTEEELMRTYPPGYSGDPSQEANRRPGTDT